jgi:hypothetical protein
MDGGVYGILRASGSRRLDTQLRRARRIGLTHLDACVMCSNAAPSEKCLAMNHGSLARFFFQTRAGSKRARLA